MPCAWRLVSGAPSRSGERSYHGGRPRQTAAGGPRRAGVDLSGRSQGAVMEYRSMERATGTSPGAGAEHRPAHFDVIGLGCVCWDLVATVGHYPAPNEKAELAELLEQGGGPTATGIVAVARLGGAAAIWGRVGDDEYGAKCIAEFRAEGVDIAHLEVAPGKTSQFAFCVVEAGSGLRTIFWKPGTMGKLDAGELDREALLDCRCLLIGSHHAVAAAQAGSWAREAGIAVVLDLERPGPHDEALLQAADYPILPEGYAMAATGVADALEAGEALHRRLGRTVVITRGEAGTVAFVEGEALFQPAFPVDPVVDTTGAGDVFHGAFAYGLTRGYGLAENLRFASAVAALKCRALGGRTGIPTLERVQELLGR